MNFLMQSRAYQHQKYIIITDKYVPVLRTLDSLQNPQYSYALSDECHCPAGRPLQGADAYNASR